MVRYPARAQPARGDARRRRARGPGADGQDRSCARRHGRIGTSCANGLRASSESRTSPGPVGRRWTSTQLPRRSSATLVLRIPASFRVSVRRADKRFPMTSPEIEREVGGRIKMARGWHVDLGNPELTIRVETLTNRGLLLLRQASRAPAGCRRASAGASRASSPGGIDSPVAAWRMMRRGCRVVFVHFHSYPILSRASQEKARELAKLLTHVPAPLAPAAGPVRRDSAACRARRRAAAAGRDLPPADDADRRGAGAVRTAPRRSSPATWSGRSRRRRSRT